MAGRSEWADGGDNSEATVDDAGDPPEFALDPDALDEDPEADAAFESDGAPATLMTRARGLIPKQSLCCCCCS
jgi:hypothetical protein